MKPGLSFISSIIALTILLVTAWAAEIPPGAGSKENNKAYQLEEVVVTATRVKAPKPDVAANITVITRDDIEKMPASTAAEALRYIPGVYVEFAGGIGSNSTARIQGSEVRHTAVYADGVPLNLLANPMTDLNYIPIAAIDRIEVYKGAASSAWGSSLGGVINIITKKPDTAKPLAADIRTSRGESHTSKNRGNISGTIDRFGYLLSMTHDRSDGFYEHSAYDQDAVYAKINYDIAPAGRVNLVYSYDNGHNKDPVIGYPDFWDDINQNRTYQRLLFETRPADNLSLTLEGRHHRYDGLIEDVYADHREVFNDYKDETWGGSARISYTPTPANTLNLGFDGDWGNYDWQNYTRTYYTRNWAIYTNDTWELGRFSINTGLRYDDNRDFGSAVSPSAGLVFRIPDAGALVRAQVARGFSAPPPAWVNDPEYGNPDLSPETAINYQLGGEIGFLKVFRFELDLFQADVKDLIRYDPDTRKLKNIDRVTRRGVEGSLCASFDFGLDVSVSGSFVDVQDKNSHETIKDIPKTRYTVSAAYTYKWIRQSVFGTYTDHNSSYPETRDKVFVFDYLLNVKPPWLKPWGRPGIFCAVYNIFNTNYLYRDVWPQPGRWVEAGVSFSY